MYSRSLQTQIYCSHKDKTPSTFRPIVLSLFHTLTYLDLESIEISIRVYYPSPYISCTLSRVTSSQSHTPSATHSARTASQRLSLSLSLSVCSRFVLYTVYILAKWFHKNEPTALSAPERAGIQTHHTVASVTSAGHLTPNDRELPARGMNHARGEI